MRELKIIKSKRLNDYLYLRKHYPCYEDADGCYYANTAKLKNLILDYQIAYYLREH